MGHFKFTCGIDYNNYALHLFKGDGKNDDEAIKHLDLVFIDKKVSSIAVFRKRMKTNLQQFSSSSSIVDKCHIFIDYT